MSDGWGQRHRTIWAVDPGDVHVGIARFREDDETWECTEAKEFGHDEAADLIAAHLAMGVLDVLVVERFALYADKATQQIGSEMLTAQLIGVIRFVHRTYLDNRAKRRSEKTFIAGELAALRETVLEFQPASIQKPTTAICRAKGIKSEAKGNAHAKSAELHGWHYILKNCV